MSETGDDFTRNIFLWLDQVVADHDLTLLAFPVAYVIAQHINRETGLAWPSQARIADVLGKTDRSVRTAIEQLVSRGHLLVEKRTSRSDSNRYRMNIDHRKLSSGIETDQRKFPSGDSTDYRKETSDDGPDYRKKVSVGHADYRKKASGTTGRKLPPNHLIEPPKDIGSIQADAVRTARTRKPKPTTSDIAFDQFWLCYPRKVGKPDARKVYDRIIASGEATHAI